ncbi:MAG: hypothetical protein ABIR47_09585 [Candidatus Kapaibacterium sp.]
MSILNVNTGAGWPEIDLRHIIALLGDDMRRCRWRVGNCESVGEEWGSGVVNALSSLDTVMPGEDFVRIVSGVYQTVEGSFTAFRPYSDTPWFEINAIDGTAFDVISDDPAILDILRCTFADIQELKF